MSFTLQYTDKETGERKSERPRLMISIDGLEKSLVVGKNIILASGTIDSPDEELWRIAKVAAQKCA